MDNRVCNLETSSRIRINNEAPALMTPFRQTSTTGLTKFCCTHFHVPWMASVGRNIETSAGRALFHFLDLSREIRDIICKVLLCTHPLREDEVRGHELHKRNINPSILCLS
ncbi:hypothetical protein PMIN06_011107 [Paraphaeosphaeria minitans]